MKRTLTLDDAFRGELRRLPPQVRARAGEALLALAAGDEDFSASIVAHPSYPSDDYIRQVRGLGYTMTIMLYDHAVVAIAIHADG